MLFNILPMQANGKERSTRVYSSSGYRAKPGGRDEFFDANGMMVRSSPIISTVQE
ncbi:hypothetical protein PILCRDRAFT_815513 [Piloderma croceum F 1598]|uniref:Uncharacterized protein n=1 Tax=Piloderma croceum (strain F 1598) TaxID=765440 RepID=A0A0C3CBI0_PILCF|nr:hypothetical protein PILCRDRAFT_815513 [Piloderma croceum F 1598]